MLRQRHARREPMRYLVFSASPRRGSLNSRLASLAAPTLECLGSDADLASMREFDPPVGRFSAGKERR
jgi:chromate reductase, NAD(P)H dehydrogenase (quinone)